jgi:protein-tyrosine phosphatase
LGYRILTLCTGNICRSPIAEFALRNKLPKYIISSAGLSAVVGSNVNRDSAMAAGHLGLEVQEHSARQFTRKIGAEADLILLMDQSHLEEIHNNFPNFSAKCFLFKHHSGGGDIPDPYKLGLANHYRAVELILDASDKWAEQILKKE